MTEEIMREGMKFYFENKRYRNNQKEIHESVMLCSQRISDRCAAEISDELKYIVGIYLLEHRPDNGLWMGMHAFWENGFDSNFTKKKEFNGFTVLCTVFVVTRN